MLKGSLGCRHGDGSTPIRRGIDGTRRREGRDAVCRASLPLASFTLFIHGRQRTRCDVLDTEVVDSGRLGLFQWVGVVFAALGGGSTTSNPVTIRVFLRDRPDHVLLARDGDEAFLVQTDLGMIESDLATMSLRAFLIRYLGEDAAEQQLRELH